MRIGAIDLDERVLIVAEIGNNHEGNVDVARELVRQAAAAGVDAVKFQTFRTEHYVSRSNTARFNRLKGFELKPAQFAELAELAQSLGVLFISTPFDLESARFLETIVDALKVASGDVNFYPLIQQVARTRKPLIISSGGSDLAQVQRTVAVVRETWAAAGITKGELAILHCVSSYPVPAEQANVRSVQFLAERLDCVVGYSDHTLGTEAAVLAVALGARIIEKHFTLDKRFSDFRDHQLAADPAEMAELVRRVRSAAVLLGVPGKTVQPCEQPELAGMRRSVVAAGDLPRGRRITWDDITWVRPAGGLPPGEESRLLGRALVRDVRAGDQLGAGDVEGEGR